MFFFCKKAQLFLFWTISALIDTYTCNQVDFCLLFKKKIIFAINFYWNSQFAVSKLFIFCLPFIVGDDWNYLDQKCLALLFWMLLCALGSNKCEKWFWLCLWPESSLYGQYCCCVLGHNYWSAYRPPIIWNSF